MYQFHKEDKISLKMKAKAVLDKFIKSDPNKNDINTNWCTTKSILNNLLNDYVPYRTTKYIHNLPWITNEIKRSMRKQDLKMKNEMRKLDFFLELGIQIPTGQILGNLGILLLNQSYHIKIILTISYLVEDPKCFWSYFKLKRTDNIGVPTLKIGTKVCNSDIDKAEALNNHFHNVFSMPQGKITL